MSNKFGVEVKRGMVFMYNPAETSESFSSRKSSVQQGYRPWLVVSNNTNNKYSTTCNIVPLTSKSKHDLPVHVHCVLQGVNNTIMVEQIRTVEQSELGTFKWELDDDIMEQVAKAISIQFAI